MKGYETVLEGQCPKCDGLLERRDVLGPCGWCTTCNQGWSLRGDEGTQHFELDPATGYAMQAEMALSGHDCHMAQHHFAGTIDCLTITVKVP